MEDLKLLHVIACVWYRWCDTRRQSVQFISSAVSSPLRITSLPLNHSPSYRTETRRVSKDLSDLHEKLIHRQVIQKGCN